jgi:hypothetical protein
MSLDDQPGNANSPRRKRRPAWVRVLNSPPFRAITTGLMALSAVIRLTTFLTTIFRH